MPSNHFHNICSLTYDLLLLYASAVLPQCSPSLRAGFFYKYALNQNGTVWCARNVITRAIITTIYMAIITLIACLVPFFGRVPKSSAPRQPCCIAVLGVHALTFTFLNLFVVEQDPEMQDQVMPSSCTRPRFIIMHLATCLKRGNVGVHG